MKAILTGTNLKGKKFKIIVTDMPDGSTRTTVHSKGYGHSTSYVSKDFTASAEEFANAIKAGMDAVDKEVHIRLEA